MEKLKAAAAKAWAFVKTRAKELTTHFAAIEAAAILAIQQSNGITGPAAKAMFALVFLQAITPEWKKTDGAS